MAVRMRIVRQWKAKRGNGHFGGAEGACLSEVGKPDPMEGQQRARLRAIGAIRVDGSLRS